MNEYFTAILNWLKDVASKYPKFNLAIGATIVALAILYVLKHFIF